MKSKLNFLKGILLSSFLILIFTLNINENIFSKVFSNLENFNQEASVISSIKPNNIYNISPSKEIPGMYNFDYAFDKVTTKLKKGEKLFDAPIAQFDDELARKILEKEYGLTNVDFGPIRDAWNYPVKPNAFMKDYKRDENKKQSFLDNLKPNKALASDVDTNNPAIYNCRANTSITGYFKAYFEDVELDTGFGYDDEAFGEGRRQEACQVLQDIGEMLMLDTTTIKPDIIFMRSDTPMPANALMGASSYYNYFSLGLDNGWLNNHIITREDPSINYMDAQVSTNFSGISWDVDSSLTSLNYDFYTVMYHEILHTLGFYSHQFSLYQLNQPVKYSTFDFNSYQNQTLTNPFINHLTNLLQVPIGAPSPWFTTNQVVYQGIKNTVGSTPDAIKPVYSPNAWQQGSSLSHFDMDRAPGETFIMHPSIGTNTERQIDNDEKDVLCHLGYMVEGLEGCEEVSPFALNDIVLLKDLNPVCINPLLNDGYFSGGSFDLESTFNISIQSGDTAVYYHTNDCTGSIIPSASGARSIKFTRTNTNDLRTIDYKNKSSLSDRISLPARIYIWACDQSDQDEYVCNGDFETRDVLSISGGAMNCFSLSNQSSPSPFWCQYWGTPDIISPSSISVSNPLGSGQNIVRMWSSSPLINQTKEAAVVELKNNLTQGQGYTLSFDHVPRVSPGSSTPVVGLNIQPILGDSQSYITQEILPSPEQIIFNQDIINANSEWYHFEQNFIADDNHKFLTLWEYIDGTLSEDSGFSYFDNISIRPTNEILGCTEPLATNYNPSATLEDGSCEYIISGCTDKDAPNYNPNATLDDGSCEGDATIKGIVYEDLNGNGNYDQNEPGIPNAQVGLYIPDQSIPTQTTSTDSSGYYSFFNVFEGDRYVALINESTYSGISEPGILNGLVSNHSHVYDIDVNTNTEVYYADFGVITNGQMADIGIRKFFADSQISLIDRFMTWRIDVTNYGPSNATNINISDVIPQGLTYAGNNLTAPNTYNSESGIINIPSLAAGQTTTITIRVRVPSGACGLKTNTASLLSLSQIDLNQSNNQFSSTKDLGNCVRKIPGTTLPGIAG